jgi:ATP-dependent DNA helicase RecG
MERSPIANMKVASTIGVSTLALSAVLIAEAFHRTGAVEIWGRGTNRVIAECRDYGLAPPSFEERQGFVIVAFKFTARQTGSPVKPGGGGTELGEKLGEKLGETRARIVALMAEYPRIAITDLANRIQITTTAVEKQIALLKHRGVVKRVGPAKGGHWEVNR